MVKLVDAIRPGDRVTIVDRFGKQRTGRAVMRGPHGWVLNMGGKHGTPGIASDANVTRVQASRRRAGGLGTSKAPSFKTYPYVVRYGAGGATFVRTMKQACELHAQMADHKPRILVRTTKGELVKRRVDPTTGRPWVCSRK